MKQTLLILMAVAVVGCGASEEAQITDCRENLRAITLAIGQHGVVQRKANDDEVTMDDIVKYMNHPPKCPSGGEYVVTIVGEDPTCTIEGHALFEGSPVRLLPGTKISMADGSSRTIHVPAAQMAKRRLKKLGAQFDYNVNGQVSSVSLQGKTLTPTHLSFLLEFKSLRRISLVKCDINDATLQGFKGLTKLTFLDVSGNPKVTDVCIDTLSTIKTLSTLNASDTGITSVGAEKLKEALPDCNVTIKAESAEPAKQP
jgi:hypothetical protein